jgi:hypothetical protein
MLDNLVSRIVGFFVRIFSLVSAVILIVAAGIIGFSIALFWPLIPVLALFSAVKAVL